jgi:integral membrane protein (TIGR01906 family)
MVNGLGGRLSSLLISLAVAVVIVNVAILPFLTPQWVAFEQGRASATAWTGYSTEDLRIATDAILADLVLGPPDFDVEVGGQPVLVERERGHMRDVRSVFVGVWLLAGVSVLVVVAAAIRGPHHLVWRAAQRGAVVLAGAVVVLGVVALVAFDVLFEVFHRILFPPGSFTFDPTTERLVQLFPFQFWQETAVVAGIVIVVLSLGVAALAGRRAAPSMGPTPASELAPTPEPSR